MARTNRQNSGVVGGSADVSGTSTPDTTDRSAASTVYARRKLAGLRGKKAAARATAAKTARPKKVVTTTRVVVARKPKR